MAIPDAAAQETLLEVRDLTTHFHTDDGVVRAVNGVSFTVDKQQVVGVIGESGCGKSVTAHSILRLIPSPPGRIEAGEIALHRNGETVDIAKLPVNGRTLREIRGREIAMIFQEPMRTLTPVYSIGYQIMERTRPFLGLNRREARRHAIDMLHKVDMPDPEHRIDAYPHQLSGGMRQRAMIAMALSCNPKLLIADEPTTALDVTIEAQILDLLQQLQQELHMSMLFITHDLGVLSRIADEVIVMYLGKIVERASKVDLFRNPKHPYTQALFRSIPAMAEAPQAKLEVIAGSVPNPMQVIQGCPFAARCPHATEECNTMPDELEVAPGHAVSCWLYPSRAP